jgi:hypothetical protein
MRHGRRAQWLVAMLAATLVVLSFAACQRDRTRSAEEVNASLLRKLPSRLEDRNGWARDVQAAFAALRVEPSEANLCAALAVVEQESTYRADPQVPDLGRIAVGEIKRRAAARHVPGFVVDAALGLRSLDGRTYAERIGSMRTERELSELYEEMIARLPLGSGRVLKGLNPVRTGGPMQVSIDFAERHARGYPYGAERSIRHEVFTRRGGLYFGIKHLLDYPAAYDRPLYRFADFNAGRYASRNAAFQVAASIASGTRLARDGDLLAPGAPMDRPGATEAALRGIAPILGMDDASIRDALEKGHSAAFDDTDLARRVYAIADAAGAGNPVPRARVPEIALSSPKITRKLTTAWFAGRVEARWEDCLAR